MATETVTAPHVETLSDDVKKLRVAVKDMDALSQGGFSEIAAIAKMALAWLETPQGQRHLDTIAHALECIATKAEDIQNCINCAAEKVGCHHVDDAWERRADARKLMQAQEAEWARRSVTHSAKEAEHV